MDDSSTVRHAADRCDQGVHELLPPYCRSAARSKSRARNRRVFTAGMLDWSDCAISLTLSWLNSRRMRTCLYLVGSSTTALRTTCAPSARVRDWSADSLGAAKVSKLAGARQI